MNPYLKVSVCMITYGHEKYIREAIEGVLMQECDFEIELLIFNDCSPDDTHQVIQNVIENHERGSRIKYVKHNQNIGMMANFLCALQACTGDYIALCEGDDYWTDQYKLQKQVDFLQKNSEYVLSFHKIDILKENGKIVRDFITNIPDHYELIEDLARFGNYIHTPSVVFRNIVTNFPYEFQLSPIGDYFLYMILAEYGKIKCLEDTMAIYRYNVGIISKMSNLEITLSNVKMYSCMLGYFKNKNIKRIILDKQLRVVTEHYEFLESNSKEIIESKYKDAFVSNHLFFLKIKSILFYYKNPNVFFRRIKKRYLK